jgi:predicted membrane channel-forming protein YqfA (hemolysin III family)
METPYYQRTIECDCLFYLAIIIYLALAAAAIFIVWLIVTRFKKFVDKVAEKEAKYKEEEK